MRIPILATMAPPPPRPPQLTAEPTLASSISGCCSTTSTVEWNLFENLDEYEKIGKKQVDIQILIRPSRFSEKALNLLPIAPSWPPLSSRPFPTIYLLVGQLHHVSFKVDVLLAIENQRNEKWADPCQEGTIFLPQKKDGLEQILEDVDWELDLKLVRQHLSELVDVIKVIFLLDCLKIVSDERIASGAACILCKVYSKWWAAPCTWRSGCPHFEGLRPANHWQTKKK